MLCRPLVAVGAIATAGCLPVGSAFMVAEFIVTGIMAGISFYLAHRLSKKNKQQVNLLQQDWNVNNVLSSGPDPEDDDYNQQKKNDFFEFIKLRADKKALSKRFGNFYRDSKTKLWWSKDRANHGGSKFKVFKETAKGLQWIFDADAAGNQIIGKHKGAIGLFIAYKDLVICV